MVNHGWVELTRRDLPLSGRVGMTTSARSKGCQVHTQPGHYRICGDVRSRVKRAMSLDITGTTTITSLGTVSAGIRKWVTFQDTLTLTHNVTSLRLPSATSITTAFGDTACFESLGSGNWVCLDYSRYNGQQVSLNTTFGDGSVSAPSIAFTADTNTGIYRPAADSIAFATNGAQQVL